MIWGYSCFFSEVLCWHGGCRVWLGVHCWAIHMSWRNCFLSLSLLNEQYNMSIYPLVICPITMKLPEGMSMNKKEVRGYESFGMLRCSFWTVVPVSPLDPLKSLVPTHFSYSPKIYQIVPVNHVSSISNGKTGWQPSISGTSQAFGSCIIPFKWCQKNTTPFFWGPSILVVSGDSTQFNTWDILGCWNLLSTGCIIISPILQS